MLNKLKRPGPISAVSQSFSPNVQTRVEQKKVHPTAHVTVLYLNLRVQAITIGRQSICRCDFRRCQLAGHYCTFATFTQIDDVQTRQEQSHLEQVE